MLQSKLSDSLFKNIAIRVSDREKMLDFYRNTLSFRALWEENALVFLGVKESKQPKLVLEQSPAHRARAVKGTPKLAVFQIQIAKKEEFLASAKHLVDRQVPIDYAWKNQEALGINLKDVEGNALSIAWSKDGRHVGTKGAQKIQLADLLNLGDIGPVQTWTQADINYMCLNVPDVEAAKSFYQTTFHAVFDEENQAQLIHGKRPFTLALAYAQGADLVGNVDKIWDLEFMEVLAPSKEAVAELAENFRAENRDFYVDKGNRILTFKDLSGIEWWYTIK